MEHLKGAFSQSTVQNISDTRNKDFYLYAFFCNNNNLLFPAERGCGNIDRKLTVVNSS